jgi:K+-sensing histidine kinase KdpD
MIARAAIGCWREPMQSWKRVAPIAVPFLIIIAVTDVGYFFKDVAHARHLVFFYLLPTAFVAMLYGSVLSMIFAIDATFVAVLFLYEPTYSLYVSDPRQVGELFLFALTALIGAKCTAELARPSERSQGPLWTDIDQL